MTLGFLVEVVGVGILPSENRCWGSRSAPWGGCDWTGRASFLLLLCWWEFYEL